MPLRDYQLAAIDATRRAVLQGSRRVCVVMPTGAGKTRTLGEIVRRRVESGGRCLWLAHRAELIDQAVQTLTGYGLSVGALCPSAEAAPQPFAPVQVATVQTLVARGLRPPADLIVCDEAHHYVAETFGALLADYPNAIVLGPTATPERSDGKGLGDIFTRIVVGARVQQLVALGHLVSAEIIAPAAKLKVGQIAQRPVDAYLEHARGRRAIVFSSSVAVAKDHAAQFVAAGLRAATVSGETAWATRRAAFDGLRTGRLDALSNVYVATEGFDVPEIDCVILARGFGSSGPYLQAVGRALRPALHAGKSDALILDLTGASHVHGHPEDDRQYSLAGRGIRRGDDASLVDQPYCRVCGAPIVAGAACSECGTAPREAKEQVVTGEKLVRYASKRREAPDARAATLRRWLNEGAAHHYAPGWAFAKFRAVYGESASREVVDAARGRIAAPAEASA